MNGIIRWFANNSVAANLLMAFILVSGLVAFNTITREIFPEFATNTLTVSVLYPGAAPEEVEEGICVRIEEKLQGLDGVRRVTSTATEGVGAVTIEALRGADPRDVLDDVKTRVDAIDTFPEEAEEPVIQEVIIRNEVLNVAISGRTDETSLKRVAERIRDEVSALDGVTQVELVSAREYEISIELSEQAMRRHGLGFDQVANAVRRASLDLPGGSVKTEGGEVLLRTKGQAYRGEQFEDIVLLTQADGSRLYLSEVATIVDGFAETDQFSRFDGEPTVLVKVFRVGDQDAIRIADTVHNYVESARGSVPEGIALTVWDDQSVYLRGRLDLLVRNGRNGLILVFLVLTLFLRFRLAFWVSVGIPISFLGAMWLMPGLDVTVNLISLFAFILVLGIVVDDAIVVGESVFTHFRRHGDAKRAAIEGTQVVGVPVIFAVLTTVAAFVPLLDVPGNTGRIWRVIPLIVIPVLLFSLIESQLILPAHLKHLKPQGTSRWPWVAAWRRFQSRFADGLETFIHKRYQPFLDLVLRWRYATVAVGVAILFITIGVVRGGLIKFSFMPPVEADIIAVDLTMPQGTPAEITGRAVAQIEAAAERLRAELDASTPEDSPSAFRHVMTSVGEQPRLTARTQSGPNASSASFTGSHLGEVQVQLAPSQERVLGSNAIAARWRELLGSVPDAVEVSFSASLFSAGAALNLQLAAANTEVLRRATEQLKTKLAEYPGVTDISDSYRAGNQEIQLAITPSAQASGLTLADLARQVRQGFYGEEAQRIQRGRDDVKVMVRYPEARRRSIGDLENMRVRTPDGAELPFASVATAEYGRGFAAIQRVDRQRVIQVTADVDQSVANANEVMADLQASFLPQLLADHLGLTYSLEGEQKEQQEALMGLARGFVVALLLIYGLMAIPFKSYVHPVVIMTAIPFGLVGAVWGHLLMGHNLSVLSLCGMVALGGVVVNDSLVLVDYINRRRRDGDSMGEAVRVAGAARFRPILLTSLTTFAGLTPMLLERSLQAQFLIPMAISLAFGVLFSTFVILLIVPSGYLILEDLLKLPGWLAAKRPAALDASPKGA